MRVRKGFWILEALSPWEGPPGCMALSFPYPLDRPFLSELGTFRSPTGGFGQHAFACEH